MNCQCRLEADPYRTPRDNVSSAVGAETEALERAVAVAVYRLPDEPEPGEESGVIGGSAIWGWADSDELAAEVGMYSQTEAPLQAVELPREGKGASGGEEVGLEQVEDHGSPLEPRLGQPSVCRRHQHGPSARPRLGADDISPQSHRTAESGRPHQVRGGPEEEDEAVRGGGGEGDCGGSLGKRLLPAQRELAADLAEPEQRQARAHD